jgi:hypothetical protein
MNYLAIRGFPTRFMTEYLGREVCYVYAANCDAGDYGYSRSWWDFRLGRALRKDKGYDTGTKSTSCRCGGAA